MTLLETQSMWVCTTSVSTTSLWDRLFVNGTQQSYWTLTDTNGNPVKCTCVTPGVMDVLTITSISGKAQNAVVNGNYELFVYSTDNLAYVWEL